MYPKNNTSDDDCVYYRVCITLGALKRSDEGALDLLHLGSVEKYSYIYVYVFLSPYVYISICIYVYLYPYIDIYVYICLYSHTTHVAPGKC